MDKEILRNIIKEGQEDIAAGAQEEYSEDAYLNKLLQIYSARA